MESRTRVSLSCPSCHQSQERVVTTMLDLEREPRKKYAVLTDSLFLHTCPSCGARFTVVGELLCLNREAGYAVLLSPDSAEKSVPAPEDLKPLRLRLARSVDELKEKILIFESLLDDRVMELVKLYLALREEESAVTLRFTEAREGKLAFSVFDGKGELLHSVMTDESLYSSLREKGLSFKTEEGVFLSLDSLWTMDAIESARG